MDVTVNISNKYIETERLVLRPWKETDLDNLYEYASVEGVGEMAGWRHHASKEVSRSILQSFMARNNVFAIVNKSNVKVIGSLGFHYSWANDETKYANLRSKEIGFVISKDYWGQGLTVEAVKAVIDYCFNEVELDILTCGHFAANYQSKRVIEKCGFSFVGTSSFYSQQMEQIFDDNRYMLSRNR